MGRARRNQRDAIRKQRAKKRKKGQVESDDDDDSDGAGDDFLDFQHHHFPSASGRNLLNKDNTQTKEQVPTDNGSDGTKRHKDQKPAISVNDQTSRPREESSSTSTTKKTTSDEASNAPIKANTGAAKKAPLDRIERMRLKKQQQKARRKEKKVAKMKLMQS